MKSEGDYAIIETAEEYTAAKGRALGFDEGGIPQATVTRAQVLEAITPKEGRQVRVVLTTMKDEQMPASRTWEWFNSKMSRANRRTIVVDDNALTVGNCGELRELIAWAKGETNG